MIEKIEYINEVFKTDITVKSRKREKVIGRFCLYYHLKTTTELSLNEIGKVFRQDHSSVLYGVEKIKNILSNPLDLFHKKCDSVLKVLGCKMPTIDETKDIKIKNLENELFKLRAEMERIQSNRQPIPLLEKINKLPEEVKENILSRMEIIIKMESIKVMKYRE